MVQCLRHMYTMNIYFENVVPCSNQMPPVCNLAKYVDVCENINFSMGCRSNSALTAILEELLLVPRIYLRKFK